MDPDTNLPNKVEVANIRLAAPRVRGSLLNPWVSQQLRAPADKTELITTFVRSLEAGSPRIILTPTITVDEDGGFVVNLAIRCETDEVGAGHCYLKFWTSVVRSSSISFTERLNVAIEEVFEKGLYPDFYVDECPWI